MNERIPIAAAGAGAPWYADNLAGVIAAVVDGFMDSLRSTGEGVLPIVLALRPELSMRGVAENDREFARRGRRQSAAEKQFFRTIEPHLREALTDVLSDGVRAATGTGRGSS